MIIRIIIKTDSDRGEVFDIISESVFCGRGRVGLPSLGIYLYYYYYY